MGPIGKIIGGGIAGVAVGKLLSPILRERKRVNCRCSYTDALNSDCFLEAAQEAAKGIKRIKSIAVNTEKPIAYYTVVSNSELSEWDFQVDFNDYGKITGTYWLTTDNDDSPISRTVAARLQDQISPFITRDDDKRELEERIPIESNQKESRLGPPILFTLSVAALLLAIFFYSNPGFTISFNQAQVTKSASQIRGNNHELIESELNNLGFKNIDSRGLGDKGSLFDFTHDGDVDYISINGDSDFRKGTWFDKNAAVIIKYHSYPDG